MPSHFTRASIACQHADRLSSDRLPAAASLLFRRVRFEPLNSAAHSLALTEFQHYVAEMPRTHRASVSRSSAMFYMAPALLAEIAHDGMKFLRFAFLRSAVYDKNFGSLDRQCSPRAIYNLTWFLYSLRPHVRARLARSYSYLVHSRTGRPLTLGIDNLPPLCTFNCRNCARSRPVLLQAPDNYCIFCAATRNAINGSHSADPIALCLGGQFTRPTNQHYLGLELEYESSSENFTNQIARQLVEVGAEKLICKRDGSLRAGAEICTIPMTLDEHAKTWEKLFAIPDWSEGAICEASPRPGLHVHISRKPAGLMQMARYARFMQGPAAQLTKYIAGRGDNSYARYRPGLSIPEILRELNRGYATDKYNVINMKHPNTLEVRAYKSTKFYDMLMARTEYTHAAMLFVARMKAEELTIERFLDWLAKSRNRGQYSHLCKMLKSFRPGAPQPSVGFDPFTPSAFPRVVAARAGENSARPPTLMLYPVTALMDAALSPVHPERAPSLSPQTLGAFADQTRAIANGEDDHSSITQEASTTPPPRRR